MESMLHGTSSMAGIILTVAFLVFSSRLSFSLFGVFLLKQNDLILTNC